MSIISVEYIVFVAVLLLLYWNIPARFQWIVLLVASIIFYIFNAPIYTFVYIGISLVSVYFATSYFEKGGDNKKLVLIATLFIIIGILAVLKYTNMFAGTIFMLLKLQYKEINWIAPLAISFYTLKLVSYTLDCYWGGIHKNERNIFKLLLYTIYFPQMISGPISRFNELGIYMFEEHRFEYDRVVYGFKRIAWGMTKKLFVAAKLKLIVDTIFSDPIPFTGIWIWLGIALFVLELYADFSGCMDIIIGVSVCIGIELTENFNAPLLAGSVQEFWQRWHITLGGFLRDYLMNPLLKSRMFLDLGVFTKKVFGKQRGKKIPAYLAMLMVWLVMGIWHGSGWRYVLGLGLWFWLIIFLEQVISSFTKKLKKNKIYRIFCVFRTFLFICIGMTFFRAKSYLTAINMFKLGVMNTKNWGIVGLLKGYEVGRVALGDVIGILLLTLMIMAMFIFELLIYNKKNPYKIVSRQRLAVRWGIYWVLVITIMFNIFGTQTDFIYAGF